MTFFIRNNKNKTILDCDVYIAKEDDKRFVEIHSSVIVDTYSQFLLNSDKNKQQEIVNDFQELSELRGWLWESYFMGDENDPEKHDDVVKILREKLSNIAKKYNLYYVED